MRQGYDSDIRFFWFVLFNFIEKMKRNILGIVVYVYHYLNIILMFDIGYQKLCVVELKNLVIKVIILIYG
jgi:hypothetical protein